MAHLVENFDDIAGFDRFAGIHHAQPVADIEDETEVVADEQHRCAVFPAQVPDQIDDSGLDCHVQRGGRLVKDQQRRFRHQRHGDDDALLLTAGKLVWVGVEDAVRVGQADIGDDLARKIPGFGL